MPFLVQVVVQFFILEIGYRNIVPSLGVRESGKHFVHCIFHFAGKDAEEAGVAFFVLLVLPIGLDRLFVGEQFEAKAAERFGRLRRVVTERAGRRGGGFCSRSASESSI